MGGRCLFSLVPRRAGRWGEGRTTSSAGLVGVVVCWHFSRSFAHLVIYNLPSLIHAYEGMSSWFYYAVTSIRRSDKMCMHWLIHLLVIWQMNSADLLTSLLSSTTLLHMLAPFSTTKHSSICMSFTWILNQYLGYLFVAKLLCWPLREKWTPHQNHCRLRFFPYFPHLRPIFHH